MANPITQIILTAVDRTKTAFSSVKTQLTGLGNSVSSVRNLLAGLGVGLTLAGVVGAFKRATDAMDATNKAAQKVGTSIENFSALSYAASQSGVPVDELEKSLVKLARTLDDAKTGSGEAADAFARLQLDPKQFKDPADALLAISERFAAMPDGINKATLAQQLFGRAGANLIPMLNAGRDGIKTLTDEAAKLGKVMQTDAARAAEKFNDNLGKLTAAGEGLVINALTPMLPGLTEVTNLMAEAAKNGGILSAIWAGIKSQTFDFLDNTQLSATYRLMRAQEQLNALRADGFAEDQHRVQQLNEWIPKLQQLAAAEKKVEDERSKNSQATSDAWAENRKAETEAFKKSTNEQITDAERLASALQAAFSQSIAAERDYLRQAKKLRDEANGTTAAPGDAESQALANLDAIAAMMKLQRTAGTESLQNVQDQAQALRDLAGQLDDSTKKAEYLKAANLAEAKALEAAAAEEKARYEELNRQQDEVQRKTENMKGALAGLGQEVSIDIKATSNVDATNKKLSDMVSLFDQVIEGKKRMDAAFGGLDEFKLSSGLSSLQINALKYGSRG